MLNAMDPLHVLGSLAAQLVKQHAQALHEKKDLEGAGQEVRKDDEAGK